MVKKGVLESADAILAWGYPFLLSKFDEFFKVFKKNFDQNWWILLIRVGIPKVKWTKNIKIDHIMVKEGVFESADAILAWGYPCLLCKVDEFFKVFKKNFDQNWWILLIKVGIPKVKWANIVKIYHIIGQEGVIESADANLAWGCPCLLSM